MINVQELRTRREIENYFEEVSTWIQENIELKEDQGVLELFIDKILEHEDLSLEQQIEAIDSGIEQYSVF
ncbi:MAG: hypothetical protein H8D97_01025 [Proteobacteria bacterium]|nr:hypothetical protein [Pseudomonadota bacterium]